MDYPMTDVIATRDMTWTRPEDGEEISAQVRIGAPAQLPPNEHGQSDWYCPTQFTGIPGFEEDTYHIVGVDQIQAIYLALALAGTLVSTCPVAHLLDWASVPNFGFPTTPPSE